MCLIAFVGNPNVGKSTLFNALTGLNQHTGNWPGKTVALAQGKCMYKGQTYDLVDLPGTYSLCSASPEEKVSEDFLKSQEMDCTVVVCDATCMERSLILALQVVEICPKVVVCVNLIDEAQRMGVQIDAKALERRLGVPMVLTNADAQEGIDALMESVRKVCDGFAPLRPMRIEHDHTDSEENAKAFVLQAQALAQMCVKSGETEKPTLTQRLDAIFLHRIYGYLTMLLLLFVTFWLTMQGANYPSQALAKCFDSLGEVLSRGARWLNLPDFFAGICIDGVYATAARVVSVMLPPMAIFFPLFTLLEDFGYLPRVAFLLDRCFGRVGACGKQSLTMCMGFGCNAVGVSGCRIIDSPRERKIALITNAFVPCNGRFPGLIFLLGLLFASAWLSALALTVCIVLSVLMTMLASLLLHRTCLRGSSSSVILELPPYRRPRFWRVLIRSLLDRTVLILGRAVAVAAPMGAILWLFANVQIDGRALLQIISEFLDAPARIFGLSGAILLAFLLGSPANELVLPILVMILSSATTLTDGAMQEVLFANGWTWQLSVSMIVFFLFHWPCTTTLWTIWKETHSKKQTVMAALLPTAFGLGLCFLINLFL